MLVLAVVFECYSSTCGLVVCQCLYVPIYLYIFMSIIFYLFIYESLSASLCLSVYSRMSIDGHMITLWDSYYKTLILFAIGYHLIAGYHGSFSYLSYSFD